MMRVVIVGRGRVGGALHRALGDVEGWEVAAPLGRSDDVGPIARDADFVMLAVPDRAVATVAAAIEPHPHCVVAHHAGALTLDALAPHPRRASLHPLVPVPADPERGAATLRGAWMAVAGDEAIGEVAEALQARRFRVAEEQRALYHAGAAIASNHLMGLLAQVQRVGAQAGVPFEAYLALSQAALGLVGELGVDRALTGPVVREDWATVRAHLAALPDGERALYLALARALAEVACVAVPVDLAG